MCPFAAAHQCVTLYYDIINHAITPPMHISELSAFVQKDPEFSMKFVSGRGEVVTVDQCRCTSFHSCGRTLNIRLIPSGEVRKVIRISIIEINGKELYI